MIGNACATTLEGHSDIVTSVAFSPDSQRIASASWDETVKIWDVDTGQCITTLKDYSVHYLKFDLLDSSLYTNVGPVKVAFPHTPTSSPPVTIHNFGYGLKGDRTQITYQGKNLLWLPPEYRPSTSAFCRSATAISCSSGRVLQFGFVDQSLVWTTI